MPTLDRRITVRVASTGTNAFGEPVENNTDHHVWAMLVQDRLARNIDAGGAYTLADRAWRVRYDQRIVDAVAGSSTVSIIVASEAAAGADPDVVTGIGEPERAGRRRFLDLLS